MLCCVVLSCAVFCVPEQLLAFFCDPSVVADVVVGVAFLAIFSICLVVVGCGGVRISFWG